MTVFEKVTNSYYFAHVKLRIKLLGEFFLISLFNFLHEVFVKYFAFRMEALKEFSLTDV